ncbi:MAG: TetR family transcriptional regulator C-terminal domain-containing protein [Rhodovibrionaceae bacterium]
MKQNRPDRPISRSQMKILRRQQLIESTIESIAKRGFAETTMADVAEGAGLSRGIVNFHFVSKEMLLNETLNYLAKEYREVWKGTLERAGPGPVDRLKALVAADFDPKVCNKKKVAVWYAFWGEAKSRPYYQQICADFDREHHTALRDICQELIDLGDHSGPSADQIATAIAATTDGLWQNLLIHPQSFDRGEAKQNVYAILAALFPKHMTFGRLTAA